VRFPDGPFNGGNGPCKLKFLMRRAASVVSENSRVRRASSVTPSTNGHANPAAAARFRLVLDRRARHAKTPPDLARAHPIVVQAQ
jgi:hypothetical protein